MLKLSAITQKTYREILSFLESQDFPLVRDSKTLVTKFVNKKRPPDDFLKEIASSKTVENMNSRELDPKAFVLNDKTNPDTKFIYLSRRLDPHKKLSYLVHELGHRLDDSRPLQQSNVSRKQQIINELRRELNASRIGLGILRNTSGIDKQDMAIFSKELNDAYRTYFRRNSFAKVLADPTRKSVSDGKNSVELHPVIFEQLKELANRSTMSDRTVKKMKDLIDKSKLIDKVILTTILRDDLTYDAKAQYKILQSLSKKLKINKQKYDPLTQVLRENPDLRQV